MRNKLDLTSLLQTWGTQSFTYTLRFSFQCVGITIDIMLQTLSVNNGVIACHHNLLQICQPRHATGLLKLFSYNLATTTYTYQQFILTSLICLVATSLFQSPKNLLPTSCEELLDNNSQQLDKTTSLLQLVNELNFCKLVQPTTRQQVVKFIHVYENCIEFIVQCYWVTNVYLFLYSGQLLMTLDSESQSQIKSKVIVHKI